jgi:predicted transcriptional regulator of viral defense system
LIEQFPNVTFIQTIHNKKGKVVLGSAYKFVRLQQKKIAGINKTGYGNRQFRITDIEKTIVDCFDLPQHSGGYAELLRAFNQAKLNSDSMIAYCQTIDNIAATKRMGFLTEFLDKKGLRSFVKYSRQRVNKRYNLFDPLGIEKGEFINDWRLRLNISRNDISDICNKLY